jgi:hypothetical protein
VGSKYCMMYIQMNINMKKNPVYFRLTKRHILSFIHRGIHNHLFIQNLESCKDERSGASLHFLMMPVSGTRCLIDIFLSCSSSSSFSRSFPSSAQLHMHCIWYAYFAVGTCARECDGTCMQTWGKRKEGRKKESLRSNELI